MNKYDEILRLVSEYITEKHASKTWEPGKDWVQYSGPVFDSKEYVSAVKTLLNEWLVLGTDAITFERKFPPLFNKQHGIVTNSGSSSNLLMMAAMKSSRLYNFPKGTRVITPVAGFPTTLNPIIQLGFEPVFVDIELQTLNLNIQQVEEAALKGAKIITFAHVLGNPPNMQEIMKIVKSYNLIFLEDCCDALGSTYDGQPLGSFGEMSSCSFYPAHHMSCSNTTRIPHLNKNNIFTFDTIENIFSKYKNNPTDIKLISFDTITGKILWKSPSNIIQHLLKDKQMYRLISQHGRNVEITEDHSVFILNDNLEVISAEAKNITTNDFIVSANIIPNHLQNITIDLIQWAKDTHLNAYVSNFKLSYLDKLENKKGTYNYKIRNSIPIEFISEYSNDELSNMKLAISQSDIKIPCKLSINPHISRLIGYFIAEGSYTTHGLTISLHKNEQYIVDDINNICKVEFGILPVIKIVENSLNIFIRSLTLKLIFETILNIEHGANNKRIPRQIYMSSLESIKAFIYSYTNGDGSIRQLSHNHTTIDVTSVSKELLNDFQYLLSYVGISASFYRRNKASKYKIISHRSTQSLENYSLKFSGWKYDYDNKTIVHSNTLHRNSISDQVPITKKVREWIVGSAIPKYNKTISKHRLIDILYKKNIPIPPVLTSDLLFLKVRKIENIEYKHDYVYDFSVPGTENFYGGFLGLFMHNSMGEGGFVACKTKEQETILRSFREWGRGCYCVGKKANLLKNGSCGCRFSNWLPSLPDEIFDHKYVYEEIGFNLKPIELQCSIGLEQLNKLPHIHKRRRENYQRLFQIFEKYEDSFHLPIPTKLSDPSWFAFPLTLRDGCKFKRSDICQFLEDNKIQTRNYFGGNILLQPAYKNIVSSYWLGGTVGNPKLLFPVATKVTTDTFFLGTSPVITSEQLNYVEEIVNKFMRNINTSV